MICPICKGGGALKVWSRLHPVIKCHFCDGYKNVSDECAQWMIEGKTIKNRRIDKRLTLRKAAKLLKMNPTYLSNMELGKLKPNLDITYDTIKTIKQ